MSHVIRNTGIAKNIGPYSDAIETHVGLRWLFTSGTPGMTAEGVLPPDIESQSRLAWENILAALKEAHMGIGDLVKVTTSLTDASSIPAYVKIRSEVLGEARPAFMLQVVNQLIKPGVLVEIEVIAAAP